MSQLMDITISTRLLARLKQAQIHVEGLSIIPKTTAELETVFQLAREEAAQIALSAETARRRACLYLEMRRLNRLLRIRPEEQIITVEAGMNLRELQEHLRQHHLLSPFVDSPDRSIGDIVAYNLPNMMVRQHADLGHWILGFEALTGDGKTITYGGDIVKNVTGHNLSYLLQGSHNQFAILKSVTLKAIPTPSYSKLTQWHFDAPEDVFAFLRQSRLVELPCSNLTSIYRTRNVFGVKLLAHFAGVEDDVSRCLQYAKDHYRSVKAVTIPVDTLDSDYLATISDKWNWFADAHYTAENHYLLAQIAMPLQAMLEIEKTSRVLRQALEESEWLWHGQANRMLIRWSNRASFPEASFLKHLRNDIEFLGGRVDILAIPSSVESMSIFQTPSSNSEKAWLERLNNTYNPYQTLVELAR